MREVPAQAGERDRSTTRRTLVKQTPISEQLLVAGAAIVPKRVVQPDGSIDQGVQSAPVAVGSDTRLKKDLGVR